MIWNTVEVNRISANDLARNKCRSFDTQARTGQTDRGRNA